MYRIQQSISTNLVRHRRGICNIRTLRDQNTLTEEQKPERKYSNIHKCRYTGKQVSRHSGIEAAGSNWYWSVNESYKSIHRSISCACLSAVGDSGCVPSSFLLTTINKCLRTKDTNCCIWNLFSWLLDVQLKLYIKQSWVQGLLGCILRFMMRHAFSMGDRSGLQVGQSHTKRRCCSSYRMWLCIVLLK